MEMATVRQIRYIEQLYCELRRSSEIDHDELAKLTKKDAGKKIAELLEAKKAQGEWERKVLVPHTKEKGGKW